jgi:hypothetical protein
MASGASVCKGWATGSAGTVGATSAGADGPVCACGTVGELAWWNPVAIRPGRHRNRLRLMCEALGGQITKHLIASILIRVCL